MASRIDFDLLNNRLLNEGDSLLSEWLPGGKTVGKEYVCGDLTGRAGTSLSINTRSGVWADFASNSDKGSDLVSLYAAIQGISQFESGKILSEKYSVKRGGPLNDPGSKKKHNSMADKSKGKGAKLIDIPKGTKLPAKAKQAEHYSIYRDRAGNAKFLVLRFKDSAGKKRFEPLSLTTDGKWVSTVNLTPRPLLGSHLLDENVDKPVIIVEGESCFDVALANIDFATPITWSFGSSSWAKSNWSSLHGRKVIIWPDRDIQKYKKGELKGKVMPRHEQPGYKAAINIAKLLEPHCIKVKVLDLDAIDSLDLANNGYDIADYVSSLGPESLKDFLQTNIKTLSELSTPEFIADSSVKYDFNEYQKSVDVEFNGHISEGFYISSEEGKKYPAINEFGDYMNKKYAIKANDGYTYIFEDGHYKNIGNMAFEKKTLDIVSERASNSAIKSFVYRARLKGFFDFDTFKPKEGLLNCKNGVLDVNTGDISPHHPDYAMRYILAHDYKPGALCPHFMGAVKFAMRDDPGLISLVQEMFGYCLVGGIPRAERAFMLVGGGSNGKSTLINALFKLLGSYNCSSVSMDLLKKPFSTVNLDGKLANLCEETPRVGINTQIFKAAVDGGYITASQKNQPEYTFRNTAKFVFACNTMPNFKDDTVGLRRRLIAIPFNNEIKHNEADRHIRDKIEKEMAGVLNWALAGYVRLVARGYKFEIPQASLDLEHEFKVETDNIYQFYSERLEFDGSPVLDKDNKIKKEDVYQYYNEFCIKNKLHTVNANIFKKRISDLWKDNWSTYGCGEYNYRATLYKKAAWERMKIKDDEY